MFGRDTPTVIIQKFDPLNKEQMTQAFAVGEQSYFWRAIMQILEDYRLNSADNSFAACGDNNPMAVAAALGAQEIVTQLMADLEKRRKAAIEK